MGSTTIFRAHRINCSIVHARSHDMRDLSRRRPNRVTLTDAT